MTTPSRTKETAQTFHMDRWMRVFGLVIALAPVLSGPLSATPYRCTTESGDVVFTDSPTQLKKCAPVDLQPSAPASDQQRPAPSAPQSRPDTPHPFLENPPPGQAPSKTIPEETSPSPSHPGQSPHPSTAMKIPIAKVGGALIVHATLNGTKHVPLILDTGATMTVLSYDVALELGLLNGSDTDVSTVNTAGGSVQVNLARIDTVQVGSASAHNISVAIHDLPNAIPGVAGLLGMSFLNHFLVTLDSNNGVLLLQHR